MNPKLEEFKNILAKEAFGETKEEVVYCILCKRNPKEGCKSALDWKEFRISGICGQCFDKMFPE